LRDRDDRDSWREFFNRYWKLVYGLAIKSGLTEGEAEEVVRKPWSPFQKAWISIKTSRKECSFKNNFAGKCCAKSSTKSERRRYERRV
jgi:hypothetical protein